MMFYDLQGEVNMSPIERPCNFEKSLESIFELNSYSFAEEQIESFFQLFAVGFELITDQKYSWNGTTRIDGPLYLFQYTISGFGYINITDKTYKVDQGYAFLVEVPSNHHYYLPKSSDSWEFYFILIRPTNLTNVLIDVFKKPDGGANLINFCNVSNMSYDFSP